MVTVAETFEAAVRRHQQGALNEAEALYRQVLQADPYNAEARHLLGVLGHQIGQSHHALTLIRQAITLKPTVAVFHYNLGIVHKERGELAEAVACNQEALRLDPLYADAHNGLGLALKDQGLLAEAAQSFQSALLLNPHEANVCNNLANVLNEQGMLTAAADYYRQALRLRPDHVSARWNLSLLRLLTGDWPDAWSDYECRFVEHAFARREFDRPQWDGRPLHGKSILLHAEQGLGDTLQFIRFAPLVKQQGGVVLVECPPTLAHLLAGAPGVDHVHPRGAPLPPFDVQAPLLSLAGIFRTTLDTIPADGPYLHASPEKIEQWRGTLTPYQGLRVGIVWQGNPAFQRDRYRSVPLKHFEPLARLESVRLISLQVGPGREQLAHVPFPLVDLGKDFDPASLDDIAGALANMDLLISSDTAAPHLAGALSVPVWLATSFVPDWRWLLERETSPWYPKMRLFRQGRLGDWDNVFERMAASIPEFKATIHTMA